MVVEDDPLTRKYLCARLEMEGLQVLEASNGQQALEVFLEHPIDLISLDLLMPLMDGYCFLRELRSLPAPWNRTPVLVLSMSRTEEDILRCFNAGADDYLTKPVALQVYVEKIWHLLVRRRN